jgi:rubrerythrin
MESSVEVQGLTRASFLVRGALATGGLFGAGAVAGVVDRALAAGGAGDVEILNFALALERVEGAFYKQALTVKGLSGDVKKALKEIAGHEAAHAEQLNQTLQQLGAPVAPAPKTSFPALGGQAAVLALAIKLEETGVGAYNGAAPRIQSPDLLGAVGSIVQVEGRHAGALRELAGKQPASAAFDKALSAAEATGALKPYAKVGG